MHVKAGTYQKGYETIMDIDAKLGFIGTGGITSAIVRGLCSAPEFTGKITLSVHKNAEKAEELKKLFPDRITISHSNQQVVDDADILFTAVLPQQLKDTLKELRFRKEQKIIQVTGLTKLEDTIGFYAPARDAVRIIPLPFAASRSGPLLIYGKDPLCIELLSLIGTPVLTETEKELDVLGPITGLMVPYYGLVAEYAKWGVKKGLTFKTALDYSCLMNEALSSYMRAACTEDTEAFLAENSTPGGVNERGLKMLREMGTYTQWMDVLEELYRMYNAKNSSKD